MAYHTFADFGASFFDTLSTTGLETRANANLASLLSNNILWIGFTSTDQIRNNGTELRLIVTYDDSGSTITNPYLMKGFVAATIGDMNTQIAAFVAANPSYFVSGAYLAQIISPRRQQQIFAVVFYNTSLADGQANWWASGNPSSGGGGAPSGPAGGDLSGTYPNPQVFVGQLSSTPGAALTVLDSVSAAAYKAMKWSIEAIKGTNTWYSEITADHDGTTPVWLESNVILAPGGGTFDFTNSVDISGGLLRLLTTPSTTGWTFRVRQMTRLGS